MRFRRDTLRDEVDLALIEVYLGKRYDPNQPRGPHTGEWISMSPGGGAPEFDWPVLSGPDAVPTEDAGAVLYHGTSHDFSEFGTDPVFLAPVSAETVPFATGFGLLPSSGKPRIIKVVAMPGPTRDVSAAVDAAIAAGEDPDEAVRDQVAKARADGVRYLIFQHPSVSGGDDFMVTVSLFPRLDLVK